MAGRALATRTTCLFSTPITSRTAKFYTNTSVGSSTSNVLTPWRRYATNSVNSTQGVIEDHSPTVDETGPPPAEMAAPNEGTSSVFADSLPAPDGSSTNWSTSYHGLSVQPFPPEAAEILMAPIDALDIEMKPGLFHEPISLSSPLFLFTWPFLQMV